MRLYHDGGALTSKTHNFQKDFYIPVKLRFCLFFDRLLGAAVDLALGLDTAGQRLCVEALRSAPGPVAAQLAGGVQVGLCAQTQPVGHGDDGPVSHRAEGRTQQRDAGSVRLDGGHFLRGGLAGVRWR